MPKIPQFKSSGSNAPSGLVQISPNALQQTTRANAQIGSAIGGVGQLAEAIVLEKNALQNSSDLAEQRLKERAFNDTITQNIAQNPGQPKQWEDFYSQQVEIRESDMAEDAKAWSPQMKAEYEIEHSFNSQAARSKFELVKIKGEVQNNNIKWEQISVNNYAETRDGEQLKQDLSNLNMSFEQKAVAEQRIREKGLYQHWNRKLQFTATPEGYDEYIEEVNKDEDLPKETRDAFTTLADQKKNKINKTYSTTANNLMGEVAKGNYPTKEKLDELQRTNAIDVKSIEKVIEYSIAKGTKDNNRATYDREQADRIEGVDSNYNDIVDDLAEYMVGSTGLEMKEEEFDDLLNRIDESGYGNYTKADLAARLFSVRANVLFDKDTPWTFPTLSGRGLQLGGDLEGQDISDTHRQYLIRWNEQVARLMSSGKGGKRFDLDTSGIGSVYDREDERISLLMSDQGKEWNEQELKEEMDKSIGVFTDLLVNKQVRSSFDSANRLRTQVKQEEEDLVNFYLDN